MALVRAWQMAMDGSLFDLMTLELSTFVKSHTPVVTRKSLVLPIGMVIEGKF